MPFNIPTLITLLRMFLIPFFVLAFYLPFNWAPLFCAVLFSTAALTDWFDGYLARRWKQTTYLGAFLDPVADKVMVAMSLVLIAEHFHAWWITLPSSIIIIRELMISALREWMARKGKHCILAVSKISKIKTIIQMMALFALLWRPDQFIEQCGIVTLYIAAILTYWSMFKYFQAASQYLFATEQFDINNQ
ncbi:MAG: CDP-diacylglycerol--glycerol-3-phosphate 3-phosphatidyltransferase [Candidatus Dasytiphilus stammeri]